jgi:hypothetical protein
LQQKVFSSQAIQCVLSGSSAVALDFAGVEKSARLLRRIVILQKHFPGCAGCLNVRREQVAAKRPATPLFAPVADKKRHIFTLTDSANNGTGRF